MRENTNNKSICNKNKITHRSIVNKLVFCFVFCHFQFFHNQALIAQSKVIKYSPSKLMAKGQWDIKWINNLYTETPNSAVTRNTYFGTYLDIYTGIDAAQRWNIGLLLNYRSNTYNQKNPLSVFLFNNTDYTARHGFGSIGLSAKFIPFKNINQLSLQSSINIPLVGKEVKDGNYLDKNSIVWQNRILWDQNFLDNKIQLYTELNSELLLGKKKSSTDQYVNTEGGYANNSFSIIPGCFLSYFPTQKIAVISYIQHYQLIEINNGYSQNYTLLGMGAKLQVTNQLIIESLAGKIARGVDTNNGFTYTIGLRIIL